MFVASKARTRWCLLGVVSFFLWALATQYAHAWTILVPFGFQPVGAVSPGGDHVIVEFITNEFKSKKNATVETTLTIFQPHTGAVAAGTWRSEADQPANNFAHAELVEGSPPFEEGAVWAWYLALHFDSHGKLLQSEENLVPVMLFEMD